MIVLALKFGGSTDSTLLHIVALNVNCWNGKCFKWYNYYGKEGADNEDDDDDAKEILFAWPERGKGKLLIGISASILKPFPLQCSVLEWFLFFKSIAFEDIHGIVEEEKFGL